MNKLFFILFLIILPLLAQGQYHPDNRIGSYRITVIDGPPVGTGNPVHEMDGAIDINTGKQYVWRRSTDLWVEASIDAGQVNGLPPPYVPSKFEYELTFDGENTVGLPFNLSSDSIVYFNGRPLKETMWSGVGSSTLTLISNTLDNDQITILKN